MGLFKSKEEKLKQQEELKVHIEKLNAETLAKHYGVTEKEALILEEKYKRDDLYISKNIDNRNKVCCPKCGSTSLSANKKGFSLGKAVTGAVLTTGTLGVGAIFGMVGKNKIIITCLNCGKRFKPGQAR